MQFDRPLNSNGILISSKVLLCPREFGFSHKRHGLLDSSKSVIFSSGIVAYFPIKLMNSYVSRLSSYKHTDRFQIGQNDFPTLTSICLVVNICIHRIRICPHMHPGRIFGHIWPCVPIIDSCLHVDCEP